MIRQVARGYRIDLIDYERPSSGLLVTSGSGILLAVMDVCPVYRWCFDQDELDAGVDLAGFLTWADRFCSPVGMAGWFNVTDPEP
jgi:hypothetical protein